MDYVSWAFFGGLYKNSGSAILKRVGITYQIVGIYVPKIGNDVLRSGIEILIVGMKYEE